MAFSLVGAVSAFGSTFTLAPASMQENPKLEMTVITELTAEGKEIAPPTPRDPVFYATDSAGFHQIGDAIPEQTLSEDDMTALLTKGLAARNYQPADATHPPSLLIVYTWGSHNKIEHVDWTQVGGDDANPGASPANKQAILKNLLERATLVGGDQFALQLYRALQQVDDLDKAQMKHTTMPTTGSLLGGSGSGGGRAQPRISLMPNDNGMPLNASAMQGMSAVERFRNIDTTHAALMAQATDDIYFVVASAYDYKFAQQKKALLLWRTRLTVDANGGVSQIGSLPTLVLTAGPYFGKDMPEAAYLRKESLGRVVVGNTQVIGTAPAPAPAAPAK